MKTWDRAGLKPEGAVAVVALAPQPNKSPIESHTKTPLCSRPIKSSTAFVSTLVLNISTGRFEPSPRAGELIRSVVAVTSSSNRVKAFSKTAINAIKRSLSTVLKRPVFTLRACDAGDKPMA